MIVTELVINALKYAFPTNVSAGHISVTYKLTGEDWVLSISDNGSGMPAGRTEKSTGLGTALVSALAQQLDAQVVVASGSRGTSVSIVHDSHKIAAQ